MGKARYAMQFFAMYQLALHNVKAETGSGCRTARPFTEAALEIPLGKREALAFAHCIAHQ